METVSQGGDVGVEKEKAVREFGRDITNKARLQKASAIIENGKSTVNNVSADQIRDAQSLREIVRNFVRVEWKTVKSESVRNHPSTSFADVSYSRTKLNALLEETRYKLPCVRSSEFNYRKKQLICIRKKLKS